jgi:hypothetical protein
MPDLKITDDNERLLVLSALISHVFKCKGIINLHNETKDALKENAITMTAEKAKNEMHEALTMIAKYFGVHLSNSKFYCLDCAPSEGAEHDRMTEAEFARWSECSKCGNGAYYFVEPKL